MNAFGMSNPVRCLACGQVYDWSRMMPMCPARYITPHSEPFMALVAKHLEQAGAMENPSGKQHHAAIDAALLEFEACPSEPT